MELKEFLKTTLLEISQGVKEANEKSADGEKMFRILKGYEGKLTQFHGQNPGLIYFDVAVSAGGSAEKSGKAGVFIKVIEFGGNIKGSEYNENISRIKFCVGIDKEIS
jgi:hypothetical protein